jgi:uncharacterized membrane protein HdeD (DUF308 family)
MADEDRSTLDVLRASRLLAFTVGALATVAGIVLLVWPDRTLVVVARLAGVLLAIVGVAQLLDAFSSRRDGTYWGLLAVRGLFHLAAGVALVAWPGVTVTVLVWVAGLDLIVTAVVGLMASRRVPSDRGRSGLVGQSLISLLFGFVLIVWPGPTITVLALVVGLLLLGLGLMLLFSGWQLGRAEHRADRRATA